MGLSALGAEAGQFRHASQRIEGQYIVVIKGQAVTPDIDDKIDRMAFKRNARIGERWKHAINGFVAQMSAADARALAQDPAVALVEEDGLVSINATQNPAPSWGLDRIDQQNLPLDSSYTYNVSGQGVTAYIIDTGILASHVDFGGRVTGGFTAIGDGLGTTDCHGHGTHVAGTVGGTVYGVAKSVNLVAVRVLGCTGSGTYSGVIAGIDWVIANKRLPAVANMSLGGGASPALDTAVQNLVDAGVTLAVAAGNSNADACAGSPARAPAALTVGATGTVISGTLTLPDDRASYSNFGTCLDLFAPGSSITSDTYDKNNPASNTATAVKSGTSMASPHVAGVAALYLSANPGATPSQATEAIVTNATVNKVTNAGIGSPNRLLYAGFIPPPPPPDTTAPTVSLTAPDGSAKLTGMVSLAANANDNAGGSGVAQVEFFVDNGSVGWDATAPYSLDWDSASVSDGGHDFYAVATDAAGNRGRSDPPVSAETSNAPPPPACSTSAQLLLNEGFENGPGVGWTASAGVIDNTPAMPARSGGWKAWLNGYGRVATESLYQVVTVPADACSANLTFWLRIATSEATSQVRDTLKVTVNNTGGTLLSTLATYSNRDRSSSYVQKSLDLSPFIGQTIRITFTGVEDRSRATSFLVDDTGVTSIR